jgi:hypothetical protein
MRVAACIEPRAVIEARRFNYERIAFPFANGVAHPGWIRVCRKTAAIGEDLSKSCERFEKNYDKTWVLNDLPGIWDSAHLRHSRQLTVAYRIILTKCALPAVV